MSVNSTFSFLFSLWLHKLFTTRRKKERQEKKVRKKENLTEKKNIHWLIEERESQNESHNLLLLLLSLSHSLFSLSLFPIYLPVFGVNRRSFSFPSYSFILSLLSQPFSTLLFPIFFFFSSVLFFPPNTLLHQALTRSATKGYSSTLNCLIPLLFFLSHSFSSLFLSFPFAIHTQNRRTFEVKKEEEEK